MVKNARLDKTFAAVISVDAVKIFKPDPRVYQLAPDKLGVGKAEIGVVFSKHSVVGVAANSATLRGKIAKTCGIIYDAVFNYWDAAGAKNFGFNVFWLNRAGAQPDALGAGPDAVLTKLTDLRAHLG